MFDNAPPDFYLMFYSLIISLVFGIIHANMGDIDKPIWPVRSFMFWIRHMKWRKDWEYRNYGKDRTEFSFREQFMSAVFFWFFIIHISHSIRTIALRRPVNSTSQLFYVLRLDLYKVTTQDSKSIESDLSNFLVHILTIYPSQGNFSENAVTARLAAVKCNFSGLSIMYCLNTRPSKPLEAPEGMQYTVFSA